MKSYVTGVRLYQLWKQEFEGYNLRMFQRDLLAGITVAAVALPLALAFGVASGATAAAGLVTAIVAGIVIAALGGARFQISGPTGAMSAVSIVVAGRFGLEGVWAVGVMAGLMIILMGIFKWGQIINFIPSAVITGFTSGIAVIIFIGQIGNLLGIDTPAAENALVQLWRYVELQQAPNWAALGVSVLVIAIDGRVAEKLGRPLSGVVGGAGGGHRRGGRRPTGRAGHRPDSSNHLAGRSSPDSTRYHGRSWACS